MLWRIDRDELSGTFSTIKNNLLSLFVGPKGAGDSGPLVQSPFTKVRLNHDADQTLRSISLNRVWRADVVKPLVCLQDPLLLLLPLLLLATTLPKMLRPHWVNLVLFVWGVGCSLLTSGACGDVLSFCTAPPVDLGPGIGDIKRRKLIVDLLAPRFRALPAPLPAGLSPELSREFTALNLGALCVSRGWGASKFRVDD